MIRKKYGDEKMIEWWKHDSNIQAHLEKFKNISHENFKFHSLCRVCLVYA